MIKRRSPLDAFLQLFSSLKCGLTLLGLLGVAVVAGTVIVQRPMAREGQIEQLYAPQTIRILNFFGLFDVFHSWWFILLLGLLGVNITLASLERFPQAWRYFSRPHMLADEWFVRHLPLCREIPIGPRSPEEALHAAAQSLEKLGYRARPEPLRQGTLYVEKHRVARLAPYVVHSSLLIIFAGVIVDGVWGYRGFMSLSPGMQSQEVAPLASNGVPRRLPFTLRCDAAGMEKYPDGSPRQYWSRLAVEENGREVLRKQIFVNEPLTYKGIRFFQSNYGSSGVPGKLVLVASWPAQATASRPPMTLSLRPGEAVALDEQGARVELADFVPDFVLEGNRISSRSDEPNNPAVRLLITRPDGKRSSVWIFPKHPQMNFPDDSGVTFQLRDLEMGVVTGLQVAKQPGQGLIWGGCLLLTVGLFLALYLSHIRIWGVVGRDQKGRPVLVFGGHPSKYRESFAERFHHLVTTLDEALRNPRSAVAELERISA